MVLAIFYRPFWPDILAATEIVGLWGGQAAALRDQTNGTHPNTDEARGGGQRPHSRTISVLAYHRVDNMALLCQVLSKPGEDLW
ncbi:hypothetical protein [Armatimonas sp.]|uniref:hypothetical protein n=1 Tax=Armatimonas sp. TaxID=1872638 RepID=UPI00374FEC4A